MDSIITFLNTTGKSFVGFSISMLIQSSVLIIVLLVLDLLLRKKFRAVLLYCIWMLILVKLVLPTTLSSPTGLGYWFGDKVPDIITEKASVTEQAALIPQRIEPVSETIPSGTGIAALPPAGTSPEPAAGTSAEFTLAASPASASLSWQGFAFLGWLAVMIPMVLLLIQRMFFVRGLLKQSENPNDSMIYIFERCRKQMGVHRSVFLKLSPVAASPSVCGLFRPTILIPQNLPDKLKSEDLRSILLHELAHINRGDVWVSFVQTLLQIAYFYNPLLWVANAIIRKVREQAVDEMVLVAMGEQAEDYPETLLNISRLTFSRPVLSLRLIGVIESKKALHRRIKIMLNRPVPKNAKIGIGGFVVLLILGFILLPMAGGSANANDVGKIPHPIASWNFDGNANDALGRHNGIVHGATLAKGRSGQAYHFDGNNDYIIIKDFSLKTFSFSAWVKTESNSVNNRRIFLLDGRENFYSLQGNVGGAIGLYITDDIEMNEYDWRFEVGKWTHIAVTYNGNKVNIFKNGNLTETAKATFAQRIHGDVYIGGIESYDRGGFWQGMIDEVALFDRALSAKEVDNLFNKIRPSVRLIVGPDRMTFEGQQVTWGQLPALLEKVTNPGNTVFKIAVSTKDMPLSRYDSAMSRASKLVKQFGFEYLSYVGQHPLDSKAAKKVTGVDITPANFDIRLDEKRGVCNLVVSIQNECGLTIPKFKLNFYRGDISDNLNEVGNVHTGWHEAGPLEPGKRWNERTRDFHLPDGQYDFNVFLDYENRIAEIDENNNRALLKVKIENGRVAKALVTCPASPKDLKTDARAEAKVEPTGSKVPAKMIGTWFFDNPHGDEEQMAVFPDGRVVVLYSNGHKDKTNIVNGFIVLAEYKNAKCRMAVLQDGTLVQYFGQSESNGKRWRRISPEPHNNLLGALSDSWRFKGKYSVKLPDDVTVELVGVCDWLEKGKRCWQPDGLELPMEIYTTKRNVEPEFGKYGFMLKVTGPDDLNFSWNKILGSSGWHGSCKVMDAFGRKFKDLTASISDMEKGRLSTTIRVGVAAGPWGTIVSHDGKHMKSGRQGGVLWSQAFQTNSGTHIVASRQWRKDQTERVIAIDKDGKIHTTSHGSVASGNVDQLTASFRNLKLGQIEEFQYQTRPYQWVEFKNVSLSPGHKTNVQF
ncbi:MAG: M56 family metallopeptidase [Planctomycetota bacterium]|jgi:beta-lactamase regulating signal transducer with metallopeptidase domain